MACGCRTACATGFHLRTGTDASSTPQGSDPVASCCVADVVGRCGGNTLTANDVVTCTGLTANRGVTATGTTAAECCVTKTCSANADVNNDVTCEAGTVLKAGSATAAQTATPSGPSFIRVFGVLCDFLLIFALRLDRLLRACLRFNDGGGDMCGRDPSA